MESKFFKVSALTAAMLGAVAMPAMASTENAVGDGYVEAVDSFIHDAAFTGAAIVDTRYRGRGNGAAEDDEIKSRLNYSAYNVVLNFNSGYANDWIGLDLGGYFSGDIYNDSLQSANGDYLCNEISICNGDGDFGTGADAFKVVTAAIKLKAGENTTGQIGFIQGGVGSVGNVWSFVPGTYRGFKASTTLSNGMTLGYMGADEFTAPWLKTMDDRPGWASPEWSYIHSFGLSGTAGPVSYNLGIGQALDVNYGQGDQDNTSYKVNARYAINDALSVAYDMYGVHDKQKYDGFAAHHGLVFDYAINDKWSFTSQLQYTQLDEGTEAGEFAPRTIFSYGSTNGTYSLWWDALSDWNMPGELAWYNRISHNVGNGWAFNLGAGYGGGAKDGSAYESEWAVNGDVTYSIQSGALKGTLFKLHATHLDRQGFDGATNETDEQDVRFMVIAPFSFF